MEIKEDEIKEVKVIGNMNGSQVKLVTLKGGFHIGMGKKEKSGKNAEILAVGSHPALINHQLEKKFKGKFEQSLTKNESENIGEVEQYSHNLSSVEKNVKGMDIFSMKKNENIEFTVTKHNFEIFSIKATEDSEFITLEKTEKNEESINNVNKKSLSKSLEKSIWEYAKKAGKKVKKKF